MPILNVIQPDFINITNEIRLCKYDGKINFALNWYEHKDTLMLVDGK